MAWITTKKEGGYLVRWREGGAGSRVASKYAPTREAAEALRDRMKMEERGRKVLARAEEVPWGFDAGPGKAYESEFGFAAYLLDEIGRDRSLRPSSQATYEHSIRNHIAGTPLGEADIRTIQPEDLRAFWTELDAGPGALRNVKQLLSKGFHAAIREGVRTDNPMERAALRAPSKDRQEEVVPLSIPEIERLAGGALTERDRIVVLMLAYGGLRAGELGGIRLQDVDFKRCQVRLREQVIRVEGEGPTATPLKTKAARRTVTLPCSITEDLERFVKENPPASGGQLFQDRKGRPLYHVPVNHIVQRAAKRAGMRPVNAHLLRHTAVSLLIDAGANPRAIQSFVGHSDIKMTLGVYGHLFEYGGQELADTLERLRSAHMGS